MTAVVRSWIAPVALDELQNSLTWLQTEYLLAQENTCNKIQYRSGKLWIHIQKPKCIQLVEFITPNRPTFTAITSDGTSSIRASFSEASTKSFEKKHGRKFDELTSGGICKITDFYFVLNPKAKPRRRLTINVINFELIGGEGSVTFGELRDIEVQPNISDALGSILSILPTLEPGEAIRPLIRSSSSSPFPQSLNKEKFPGSSSNAMFSTQLPGKTDSRALNCQLKQSHTKSVENLLSVLIMAQNRTKDNTITLAKAGPPTLHISPSEVPLEHSQPGSQVKALSKSPEILPFDGKFAGLCATGDNNASQLPEFLNKVNNGDTSEDNFTARDKQNVPYESKKVNKQKDASPKAANAEINHSQTGIASINRSSSEIAGFQYPPERNIFEGLKRIPRNYVRIPKDQRRLLDDNSSWIQLRESSRASRLNLPPKVLDTLVYFNSRSGHEDHDQNINPESGGSELEEEADLYERNSQELEREDERGLNSIGTIKKIESKVEKFEDLPSISNSPRIDKDFHKSTGPSQTEGNLQLVTISTPIQDEEESNEGDVSWAPSPVEHLKPITNEETYNLRTSYSPSIQNLSRQTQESGTSGELPSSSKQVLVPASGTDIHKEQIMSSAPSISSHANPASDIVLSSNTAIEIDRIKPHYGALSTNPIGYSESSSDEEEMELVVPHTVDDPFDPNVIDRSKLQAKSQTLSSNSSQKTPMAQVKQTPFGGHLRDTPRRRLFEGTERRLHSSQKQSSGDTFSDPVIPCTFADRSIGYAELSVLPSLKSGRSEGLEKEGITLSYSPQHSSVVNEEGNGDDENGDRRSLPTMSSQIGTSSFDSTVTKAQSLRSPVEENIEALSEECEEGWPGTKLETPNDEQTPSTSNNFHSTDEKPSTEIGHESDGNHSRISSDAAMSARKRSNENSQNEDYHIPLKRRRIMKVRELKFSSQEQVNQDPSEMARANRLNFIRGLSAEEDQNRPIDLDPSHINVPDTKSVSLPEPQYGVNPEKVSSRTAFDRVKESSLVASSPKIEDSAPLATRLLQDKNITQTQEDFRFTSINSTNQNISNERNFHIAPAGTNLLKEYKSTYPTFLQSELSILRACVYLEWLISQQKAPHPYLWDDFIHAFCTQYVQYIRSLSKEEKGEAISGIEFYNKEISSPVFLSRVITPESLQETFSIYPKETELWRSKFQSHSKPKNRSTRKNRDSSPSGQIQETEGEGARPEDEVDDELNSTTMREIVNHTRRKPYFETPSQMIDQNKSSLDSSSLVETIGGHSKTASSRKLPWPSPNTYPKEIPTNGMYMASSSLDSARRSNNEEDLRRTRRSPRRSLDSAALNNSTMRTNSPTRETRRGGSRSLEVQHISPHVERVAKLKATSRRTMSLPHPEVAKISKSTELVNQQHSSASKITSERQLNKRASDHNRSVSAPKPLAPEALKEISSFRGFITSGKFIRRRSSALSLSSQASMLNSTPDTGSSKSHSKHAEPETQAWGFE
ncbi:hypothetical protein B7463_g5459, partial [Scytalidium lignicola]